MKTFVITNNKGGTGKTTLSKLLAERFAIDGKRVLGIDLDPQCSFSHRFMEMDLGPRDKKDWIPPVHPDYVPGEVEGWDGRSSSADVFLTGLAFPYPTHIENLEIIPGHSTNLLQVERVRKNDVHAEVLKIMREWVNMDEIKDDYDICIFDTGPSKGPLTASAIHASTHMLIPAEMEQQSIEGLFGMIQLRTHENLMRSSEEQIELIGILPNKFKTQRKRQHEHLTALREEPTTSKLVMPHEMHDWTAYADDAHSLGLGGTSLFNRPPSDKARQEFEIIYNDIVARVF